MDTSSSVKRAFLKRPAPLRFPPRTGDAGTACSATIFRDYNATSRKRLLPGVLLVLGPFGDGKRIPVSWKNGLPPFAPPPLQPHSEENADTALASEDICKDNPDERPSEGSREIADRNASNFPNGFCEEEIERSIYPLPPSMPFDPFELEDRRSQRFFRS